MVNETEEELAKIFVRTGDLAGAPCHAVIGDSHALFFAGVKKMEETHAVVASAHPGYRVYYVGPGLASSLVRKNSRNLTRAKAMTALGEIKGLGLRHAIFAFGEIDCRYHIRKRAARCGADRLEGWILSARITALRYISFLLEVKLLGILPVIWAPPPTTLNPPGRHPWITIGTVEERNTLTRYFIDMLAEEAHQHGLGFVSIFDALVDGASRSRENFTEDQTHIAQMHWPLWQQEARRMGLEA